MDARLSAERRAGEALGRAIRRVQPMQAKVLASRMLDAGYVFSPDGVARWDRQRGKGMPAWALIAVAEVTNTTVEGLLADPSLQQQIDDLREENEQLRETLALRDEMG